MSKPTPAAEKPAPKTRQKSESENPAQEIGGPEGPEPIRFGDWEKAGRCSDF